jgi:hypothetical protein
MRAFFGTVHDPVSGCQLAQDQLEQGGLAGAIAAHEADLVPFRQRNGRVVDQQAPFDAVCQVVDVQHGWCGV